MKLKRSTLKIIANYHLHAWKIVLHLGLLIYWCIIISGHFFTIELKLTKAKKIRFSPHQIGFHIRHPHNSFIMQKALGPLAIKLYEGSKIQDLVAGSAEPVATGLRVKL